MPHRTAVTVLLLAAVAVAAWLTARLRQMLLSTRHPALQPAQLADPQSRFIDVAGLRIHYKMAGQGEPVLVLLHGSFLSLFSWREVLEPLTQHGTVIALDRPSFGLTERSLEPFRAGTAADGQPHRNAYSPEAQADLVAALLDRLGIEQAILVGSSTGGTIALLTTLRHPQRVRALVLVGAMVYSGYPVSEMPRWMQPLLRRLHRVGPLMVRGMVTLVHDSAIRAFWHDESRLTPEVLAHYRQALQMANWEHATWELILATHRLNLAAQVPQLTVPALVITGEQDRIVPTSQSVRLAQELPNASIVKLPECGHLPHEECPAKFLHAVNDFFARTRV